MLALVPTFKLMYDLSKILREKRHDRGSIDFDLEESKIIVDEYGFPNRCCATPT